MHNHDERQTLSTSWISSSEEEEEKEKSHWKIELNANGSSSFPMVQKQFESVIVFLMTTVRSFLILILIHQKSIKELS